MKALYLVAVGLWQWVWGSLFTRRRVLPRRRVDEVRAEDAVVVLRTPQPLLRQRLTPGTPGSSAGRSCRTSPMHAAGDGRSRR